MHHIDYDGNNSSLFNWTEVQNAIFIDEYLLIGRYPIWADY